MKLERLQVKDLAPDPDLVYVDVFNLHDLFDKLAFRDAPANVILQGPKGIGKTLSISSWARKQMDKSGKPCPVVTVDCSEDVRRTHLLGTWYLKGNQSPFVLGPIPTAFEIANEVGRCILQFEEINALMPQMQKILNPITDWRRKLELPEIERVFRLKKGAKLWVTGTLNTSVYGGVYSLNEDLKSRMRMPPLGYPKEADERRIIQAVLGKGPSQSTINQVLTLVEETRQQSLEYPLSTRDAIQLLEDIGTIGLEQALWMLTGKFEGEDQKTIKARYSSIFRTV